MALKWLFLYGNPHLEPIWGPQTSAVNFCEEDYVITRLVGEFFNTLTNLMYIAYGAHGIRRLKQQEKSLFAAVNLPYWGLIGVGVCSGAYHTTLKYHTQMSDELSMHVAIGTVMHQIFTFEQPPERQRLVRYILLGVLVPFFVYHCAADEFAVHGILFLSMVGTVIWKTRRMIHERIHDTRDRKKLASLASFAAGCAAVAYALWNVDVLCCPMLTRWKRQLGLPWGAILEFHGWWHVLTAIAAYTFMAIIEVLTCPEDSRGHGSAFAWPATAVLGSMGTGTWLKGSQHSAVRPTSDANGALHDEKGE